LDPIRLSRRLESSCGCGCGAAQGEEGGRDNAAENGAYLVYVLVVLAVPDVGGARGLEVWSLAGDIGDRRPMKPHGSGKILSRHARALVAIARVPEVGVSVDVDEAYPPASR